jgi:hypothetical protein
LLLFHDHLFILGSTSEMKSLNSNFQSSIHLLSLNGWKGLQVSVKYSRDVYSPKPFPLSNVRKVGIA